MKLKNLLILFLLSFFFMGTLNDTFDVSDTFAITYEISEQVEVIEDNKNFLQPILLLSYATLNSHAIGSESSFFQHDNFIDIEKPPIIS